MDQGILQYLLATQYIMFNAIKRSISDVGRCRGHHTTLGKNGSRNGMTTRTGFTSLGVPSMYGGMYEVPLTKVVAYITRQTINDSIFSMMILYWDDIDEENYIQLR